MGRLFELVEEYRRRFAPHEPSYARVAEKVGVSRQTLLNWRTPTKLIDKDHLVAIASLTGAPYSRVLDALLDDIGYLRPSGASPGDRAELLATLQKMQRADAATPDEGDVSEEDHGTA